MLWWCSDAASRASSRNNVDEPRSRCALAANRLITTWRSKPSSPLARASKHLGHAAGREVLQDLVAADAATN